MTPTACKLLTKEGFAVAVEDGAGLEAKFSNADYEAAGAKIVGRNDAFGSEIIFKVRQPSTEEIPLLKTGSNLVSFLYPAQNKDLIDKLAESKVTVFAVDQVPRISRAQVFDALSSMANIAGYKAVIEAANQFGRFSQDRSLPRARSPLPRCWS